MKAAWETAVAYQLVWVRLLLLLIMPMIASYLGMANTIDLDTKWPTMGMHARIAFWLAVISPGLAIFVAFLDQSYARAKDDLAKKRSNGDTQLFTRKDTGP